MLLVEELASRGLSAGLWVQLLFLDEVGGKLHCFGIACIAISDGDHATYFLRGRQLSLARSRSWSKLRTALPLISAIIRPESQAPELHSPQQPLPV